MSSEGVPPDSSDLRALEFSLTFVATNFPADNKCQRDVGKDGTFTDPTTLARKSLTALLSLMLYLTLSIHSSQYD